jgi:hypothetical protein
LEIADALDAAEFVYEVVEVAWSRIGECGEAGCVLTAAWAAPEVGSEAA